MEHETELYTDKVLGVFLRVVDPLKRLLDSSRCRDLGLLLRDLVRGRGLTRPCPSINACCFLRRYSCLISSRRAFSSSLRMRSSSAFRLEEMDRELRFLHTTVTYPYNQFVRACDENVPGLVTFELNIGFLLLFAESHLFSFALLFQEEGSTTLRHFVLCFLVILEDKNER